MISVIVGSSWLMQPFKIQVGTGSSRQDFVFDDFVRRCDMRTAFVI